MGLTGRLLKDSFAVGIHQTVRMRTCPLRSKWLVFIVTCVEQAVYRDTPDWVNVAQNLLTLAVRVLPSHIIVKISVILVHKVQSAH